MNKLSEYQGSAYWNADIIHSTAAVPFYTITSPYDGNPLDLTIFVSCYNEEIFIIDTLTTITNAMKIIDKTYEIIIIDDGSTDRSVALVKDYIANHPEQNLTLRINKKNKGLAQNYIDGAFLGRGKYYRLICGDNAEPIETMVSVFKLMGTTDIVIPYYVSAEGKSASRQFISKLYTRIINLFSGHKIHYYNGLQIHLRHNVMRWHPNTRGFAFQAGLLCMLLNLGFTYVQVPCITVELRGGGGNALTWKNLRSVVHMMFSILIRRIAP